MAGQKQVYSYEFMKQLIFVYYLLIIIFICITTVHLFFPTPVFNCQEEVIHMLLKLA